MRNAILVSALVLATPLAGDQLRIATSNDWRQWQLPGDAVEVARGTLKPSFVRRNINAVANAFDFASGGIRKVGSNPGDALKLIDGDLATRATFRALRLAGEPVTAPVEETENGFKVLLAEPVRRSALIEIDFENILYLNQTRFEAFLFNSALSTTARQQVDPGDAEAAIASDRTFVSLPTDGRLFADLSLSNRVLTPNGDGISDQLQIDLNLFKMLDPRPVIIGVYNLTGHRVALISNAAVTRPINGTDAIVRAAP